MKRKEVKVVLWGVFIVIAAVALLYGVFGLFWDVDYKDAGKLVPVWLVFSGVLGVLFGVERFRRWL